MIGTKPKWLPGNSVISFAISFSRSLLAIALLIGVLYGGAVLLDTTFDFFFQTP